MEQARRFKAMYSQLGLTEADVARFLQVTTRTVYAWISGRARIPYAAYKLLRLQLHYELPGDAWKGWSISAGRLYTPENFELHPRDFYWWGLLARKAAMFNELYKANNELRAAVASLPGGPVGDRAAACRDRGSERPEGPEVLVTPHFSLTSETFPTAGALDRAEHCAACKRSLRPRFGARKGGVR
ncbi:VC1465 family Xer recombination activation factor [Hydrogenophaga sp. ANAO-22]|uniref:VC1465 family Xer recombination activation factor n=1 Tax=Hydrogenophaga sp. ANAO-22 TaxID=3166645 RepID=UPI0036D2ECFB